MTCSIVTERLERTGVDLVLQLSENNAPRRCSMCELDTEFYVYTDSVVSMYICGDHLGKAVKKSGLEGFFL